MRIKELAARTAVTPRLLRYYEDQGLIRPRRENNGWRDYDEELIGRVQQIRELLAAGLSTRMIKEILPCLAEPESGIHFTDPDPAFLETLVRERDHMSKRIELLTKNRDALTAYLEALQR